MSKTLMVILSNKVLATLLLGGKIDIPYGISDVEGMTIKLDKDHDYGLQVYIDNK